MRRTARWHAEKVLRQSAVDEVDVLFALWRLTRGNSATTQRSPDFKFIDEVEHGVSLSPKMRDFSRSELPRPILRPCPFGELSRYIARGSVVVLTDSKSVGDQLVHAP